MGFFIKSPPKFYNNVFSFFGLTILRTLMNYDLLAHKLNIQMFQPIVLIYRRDNFVYHHCGDVHQFIGHCLIPLKYLAHHNF